MRRLSLIAALFGLLASPVMAQSSLTYKQDKLWSTSPCGIAVCGASESQSAHYYGGLIAGQVTAANMGMLSTTNYSQNNYAVGVLNQTSVTGTNNTVASGQTGATNGNTTNRGANSMSGDGSTTSFNPF